MLMLWIFLTFIIIFFVSSLFLAKYEDEFIEENFDDTKI